MMGCIYSYFKCKKKDDDTRECLTTTKEYSWDKRPKTDRRNYTIEHVNGHQVVRFPGSINGRQFIIQNCQNARIFLFDHSSSITVDDCINCKIILGPTSGSVFIRNCENCALLALCGQFRARDCSTLSVYLCCPSQPALEACCNVSVGCCLIHYAGLHEQMKMSGLSPFNNQWDMVYDFTPVPSEGSNWQAVSYKNILQHFSSNICVEEDSSFDVTLGDVSRSVIPLTCGKNTYQAKVSEENCLVVILPGDHQSQNAYDFIAAMNNLDEDVILVATHKRTVGKEVASTLLQGPPSPPHLTNETQLLLIGLQFAGNGCIAKCQQIATHTDPSKHIHVSPNTKQATLQILRFMQAVDQT